MKRLGFILSSGISILLLNACVNRSVPLDQHLALAIATSVSDCQSLLLRPTKKLPDKLVSRKFRLLNWNINKGSKDLWNVDLRSLASDVEFVTIQEAVLASGIELHLDDFKHSSFSRGFTTQSKTTGVVTYSKSEPLSECGLSVKEPWLRTRKAISITEFGIIDHDETLLLVNVHAVNISIGLVRFREQMEQIRQVLSVHNGPAILSGDFNTWRRERLKIVLSLMNDLSFTAVIIAEDNRTTFNNYPLDHVFVRELTAESSEAKHVTSSDHNPIIVELSLLGY